MGRFHLLMVAAALLILAHPGFAETPIEDPEAGTIEQVDALEDAAAVETADGTDDLAWDQFDDPNFDPNAADAKLAPDADADATAAALEAPDETAAGDEAAMEIETASESMAVDAEIPADIELTGADAFETSHGIVLGPKGIDDQGRSGRLHTVSSGDTLWDLADAYLGTAWVWPSVWIDNDNIDNPHLIVPGDRIWITANEMRVVTVDEADSFLETAAMAPEMAAADPLLISEESELMDAMQEEMPVEEPMQPLAALEGTEEDPSTLDAFPVAVAGLESESVAAGTQLMISRRHAMGFVTEEELAGSSTIVDSSVERVFLSEGDPVVLGTGEGDVEVGDQFTIFQVIEQVRDVETNRVLGHHVEILGWLVVRQLTGDTSIAEIEASYEMMRRGVRVKPRVLQPSNVTSRATPDAIEGKIVFLPYERALMAGGGYVYLNRGEFHGVEVGSELEVFEPGIIVNDRSRRVDVRTPDHTVAKLVVVSVMADTSVAFVVKSSRELWVGDDVRPRVAQLAGR